MKRETISGADYADDTIDVRYGIVHRLHQDGLSFVDRGDPADWDFQVSDLTTDNTYRTLDLSNIIPDVAKAVLLYVRVQDGVTNSFIWFREKGNSNTQNRGMVRTQVADLINEADLIIPCANGVEYRTSLDTFDTLDIAVKGWWQ